MNEAQAKLATVMIQLKSLIEENDLAASITLTDGHNAEYSHQFPEWSGISFVDKNLVKLTITGSTSNDPDKRQKAKDTAERMCGVLHSIKMGAKNAQNTTNQLLTCLENKGWDIEFIPEEYKREVN